MSGSNEFEPRLEATNAEISAAATIISGVLFNVIMYHLAHFPEGLRRERASQTFDVMRSAVTQLSLRGGTDEERANAESLVDSLVAQTEQHVNDELDGRKSDIGYIKH